MDRTNQDGKFSSSSWDDSAYAQNQVTHRGHTHHVIVTSCYARRGPEALSHTPEAPKARVHAAFAHFELSKNAFQSTKSSFHIALSYFLCIV